MIHQRDCRKTWLPFMIFQKATAQTSGKKPFRTFGVSVHRIHFLPLPQCVFCFFLTAWAAALAFPAGAAFSVFMIRPQRQKMPAVPTLPAISRKPGSSYTPGAAAVSAQKSKIQASAHWKRTVNAAQRGPSSRRIEAIAATQGVYSRQNTSSAPAPAGAMTCVNASYLKQKHV